MFGLNRCGPIRPRLWEYAEGTLSDADDAARVERHLAACAACRALLDEFRTAAPALRDFAATGAAGLPARPARWDDLRSRLDVAPGRARRPVLVPALGVAAGALALSAATLSLSAGGRQFERDVLRSGQGFYAPTAASQIASADPSAPDDARFPVRLSVEPTFQFLPPRGTYPLTVRIRNTGRAVRDARLSVAPNSAPGRLYRYDVDLPENSVTTLTVYPTVRQWGAAYEALDVSLAGPFPRRTAVVPITTRGDVRSSRTAFAYIGDQFGALESNRRQGRAADPFRARGYTRPELAPERAIGYDSVDVLALGRGAERLSGVQWSAIRQWVLAGGSLVFTAGLGSHPSGGFDPTSLSALGELLPVSMSGRTRLAGQDPASPPVVLRAGSLTVLPADMPREVSDALPQSQVLDGNGRAQQGTFVRRRVGAGTVLYVGLDPAANPFRESVDVEAFWDRVASLAAPTIPAVRLRSVAAESLWFRSGVESAGRGGDPFRVTMPRVGTVVNVFAAYFLLAVPVTFVVLKRLRRMEWAWATGPALAVVTAGGVALLTVSLYAASLSRRTAGILVGSATGEARFVGFTEAFFPRSGTFPVNVPGAEELESHPQDGGEYNYYAPRSTGTEGRALTTLDAGGAGGGVTTSLSVSNLSFRRLYHNQTVRLSGGVSGSVRYHADGGATCEVRNDTGRTLENVFIVAPNPAFLRYAVRSTQYRAGTRFSNYYRRVPVGDLAPGETFGTRLEASTRPWGDGRSVGSLGSGDPFLKYYALFPAGSRPETPVVVAQMSGREFGPDLGKSVGDERSVVALFALPPSDPPAEPKGGRR